MAGKQSAYGVRFINEILRYLVGPCFKLCEFDAETLHILLLQSGYTTVQRPQFRGHSSEATGFRQRADRLIWNSTRLSISSHVLERIRPSHMFTFRPKPGLDWHHSYKFLRRSLVRSGNIVIVSSPWSVSIGQSFLNHACFPFLRQDTDN